MSAFGGQKLQFWANLEFLGAPVPTPFYRWVPNLVCYSWRTVHVYVSTLVSIGLFSHPLAAKNPIFAFFEIRHLVMSTTFSNLRKLNTGAQLQTFPYPMASKPFLFFNVFMAKSGEQTLTFKSVTDRKSMTTKKSMTDRQKTQRFSPPRRQMIFKPHQTWHGDRGPRARSCISKTFGVWRIASPLKGTKNLG